MRTTIESQFSCRILSWGEPTDDLGGELWSAWQGGTLLVADSLALLIAALQEREPRALLLWAA